MNGRRDDALCTTGTLARSGIRWITTGGDELAAGNRAGRQWDDGLPDDQMDDGLVCPEAPWVNWPALQ